MFDYLERTRTSASVNELTSQKLHMQLDIVENVSERSLSGVYKTRSVAGSPRYRASVKKMVATTKLSFLEKERDLRKQMLELETRFDALKEHKSIALAEAEMGGSEAESAAHLVHRDIKVEAPSSGGKGKGLPQ